MKGRPDTPSGDGVRPADEKSDPSCRIPGCVSWPANRRLPRARRADRPCQESAPVHGADDYDTEKVNDTSAVPPVVTVTFWVWVPSASCHASRT